MMFIPFLSLPRWAFLIVAWDHYNQQRTPLIALLNRQPLGSKNIIDFLSKLANDSSTKGCLLVLSINERDLLESAANRQVKKDFQSLQKLFELNLKAELKGSRRDVTPMALLLCAQIFSIAGMGKLNVTKDQINKSIKLLLSQLFETR
ncbi:MAG: hypothetical protein ABW098_14645 [Candidatus Thiodiazotropha sp.]